MSRGNPSDLCMALAALHATVVIQSRNVERRLPSNDLHQLPGDTPDLDTQLQHGEMITALDIAPLPLAAHSRYRKVRDQASAAFALISVAAALDVREGMVRGVRLGWAVRRTNRTGPPGPKRCCSTGPPPMRLFSPLLTLNWPTSNPARTTPSKSRCCPTPARRCWVNSDTPPQGGKA